MLELALLLVASIAMAKVADSDGMSPYLWGLLTLGIGFIAVILIPLPFLSVLIGPISTFILMIFCKPSAP